MFVGFNTAIVCWSPGTENRIESTRINGSHCKNTVSVCWCIDVLPGVGGTSRVACACDNQDSFGGSKVGSPCDKRCVAVHILVSIIFRRAGKSVRITQ